MSRKIIGITVGTPQRLEKIGMPSVTEADNGKILQVVNGVWMLVEVVNGNTALFYEDGNEVAY